MVKNIVKDFLYEKESYEIRGAIFEVWKSFKGIFKEKVVDRAIKKELESRGFKVETQKRIDIYYKGEKVGEYIPDQIVNDAILIEIKVKPYLTKEDERQFWYYLRGSQYKLGFLINFGSMKVEIRRRVYDKAREKYKKISVNQRTYQRNSASINGFTLIEILVSTGIILMLLSLFLVSFRTGESQYALELASQKLEQDLRRMQNLALAPTGIGGATPKGYGVHFDSAPSSAYKLFADINDNRIYESLIDKLVVPEVILEKGTQIFSQSPAGGFNVVFIPPDPTTIIKSDSGPESQESSITLNLKSDPGKTKIISIKKTGLIEIQ